MMYSLTTHTESGIPVTASKASGTDRISPILAEALRHPSNREADWLHLATRLAHISERRFCLRYALYINPHSEVARQALEALKRNLPAGAAPFR
jgi:hypothetical protein